MPNVDTNAPLATNSDVSMWRRDHASAIRYIEALLEERERWAPVMEKAQRWARTYNTFLAGGTVTEKIRSHGASEQALAELYVAVLTTVGLAALKEGEDHE